jgi:hypothetical protein
MEGAESTVMPSSVALEPFRTSDGYLWKYMYNIPVFKRTKFMSAEWIPVQKAISDSFYNKGALQSAVVSSGGSGYEDTVHTTMSVSGTTSGSSAAISIASVSSVQGAIETLNINNGGGSYITGTCINITQTSGGSRTSSSVTEYADDDAASVIVKIVSPSGSGALIKLILTAGVVTDYSIIEGGYGYSITDTVDVVVGGAELIPSISATGAIKNVQFGLEGQVGLPGAGYSSSATTNIDVTDSLSSGHGAWGNPSALFSPIVFNGSIVRVNTVDEGINYSKNSTTTITVQGDGSGCEMTPQVYNGEITDVIVDAPGEGYTYAKITVTGTGTGAEITPTITQSDFDSDQSIVEQVATPGAIYSIKMINKGTGYTSNTVVTITGDGDNIDDDPRPHASAIAIVENGQITAVRMTSFGYNYTKATVTFTDSQRAAGNTDATAYVVLPPLSGHGYDAVTELGGSTLAISTIIRQNLTASQLYYRQYGLLKDITVFNTNRKITNEEVLLAYTCQFDVITDLAVGDSLIYSKTRTEYKVIDIAGTTVKLQQLGSKYERPDGQMYAAAMQSNLYTSSCLNDPSPFVNKYSGEVLFSINSAPFTFSSTQGILFKTFIKF